MVFLLRVLREQEDYLVSQGVHVIYKPFDLDHLRANVKQLLETYEHASLIIEEEHKSIRRTRKSREQEASASVKNKETL